jgi:hypothetical protein
MSGWGRDVNHDNFGDCGAARDLIKEKTKRIEKLGQKYEKYKFD